MLTFDDIYIKWKNHFSDVLLYSDLQTREPYVSNINLECIWCECPSCGNSSDHFASYCIPPDRYYDCGILTCYVSNQQWLIKPRVIPRGEIEIQKIILEEETKFLDLLQKSEKIVQKITKKKGKSEETIKYLFDTHGIPEDVVRDIWGIN